MGTVVEVGSAEEGDEHDGDERTRQDALSHELGRSINATGSQQ